MVEGMGWLMPQPETVNLTKLHWFIMRGINTSLF
jgi:hypothetical protein